MQNRKWYITLLSLASVLSLIGRLAAQDNGWPKARPEDVRSPTAIVKASYAALSGPPGQSLNLDRFRSLFLPGAQLVSVSTDEKQPLVRTMTVKEFVDMITTRIGKEGHIEHEIAARSELYGNIAHIWSSYESRRTPQDSQVIRGINSIQLFNDGQRWWISGAQWQHETTQYPIPAEYLSRAR
jgi:hypothetical protein